MTVEKFDLIVAGGSVAGMTLVLALRDVGLRIAVIDRQVGFSERELTWGHDLEPNGLAALEAIGLRETFVKLGGRHEQWIAEREGGGALSTWRYSELGHTYDYAVCIRAHILRTVLREKGAEVAGAEMLIPAELTSIEREHSGVQVTVKAGETTRVLSAPLLIGADGPTSKVRRAAGIGAETKRYEMSWADTIMGRPEHEVGEGYIYFGRGSYLGIVPTRERELVAFHLTRSPDRDHYAASFGSIEGFRRRYAEMAPVLASCVDSFQSWDQMTVAPALRVRAERWVTDHVALVGDAAVTVNPITSQGVCLALEGAVSLATVVKRCFERGSFTARSLYPYEVWRRGQAEMVQRLGDLCAWGFGANDPVLSYLKERMLMRLQQDPNMRRYVMAAFCGLHWLTPEPLRIADGLASAGVWFQGRGKYAMIDELAAE